MNPGGYAIVTTVVGLIVMGLAYQEGNERWIHFLEPIVGILILLAIASAVVSAGVTYCINKIDKEKDS